MKIIQSKEYKDTIEEIISELKELLAIDKVVYSIKGDTLITERLLTSLRQKVNGEELPLRKMIYSQILESVFISEKKGPNSTDLFIEILIKKLENIFLIRKINPHKVSNDLEKEYDEIKARLVKDSNHKLKWEEVEECVRDISMNTRIADMVLEAINLAGLEGKIFPSWSPTGEYSVELATGYNFPVTTYPIFTQSGKWDRKEVKCLIVDGTIEKESEIHKIFFKVAEEKSSLLIVARGYGEEVIATIVANKNLDICPIRIPFELESINILSDIGVVAGCNIISAMKGDMLSMAKYEELYVLEQVICTKQNLNITNDKTNQAVINHYNELSKKINEVDPHLEEFISNRIKSLVSHTVHIRIGSRTEQERIKELEAVDFGLRVVKGILQNNIVDIEKYGFKKNIRPIISVLSAYYYCFRLINNLMSVEIAILS